MRGEAAIDERARDSHLGLAALFAQKAAQLAADMERFEAAAAATRTRRVALMFPFERASNVVRIASA